jgi:hypothetical protein
MGYFSTNMVYINSTQHTTIGCITKLLQQVWDNDVHFSYFTLLRNNTTFMEKIMGKSSPQITRYQNIKKRIEYKELRNYVCHSKETLKMCNIMLDEHFFEEVYDEVDALVIFPCIFTFSYLKE